MIADLFGYALHSLRSRRLRSWLTIIGIFIGIAAVVSLIGLGQGLRTAITSQFGISSTEVISIQAGGISGAGPPGTGVVNPLTEDDADAIESLGSVEVAIPRIIKTGQLEFNDHVAFGMAMSIPEGEERDITYELLDLDAEEGRVLKRGDSGKVVLGYNFLADKVGLGKPVHTGNSVIIHDRRFEVVGITKKKGSFIFDNIVHMDEDELKDLFGIKDNVDVIAAKVKGMELMDEAKADIEKLMRKRRGVKVGEEDFQVQTPQQLLSDLDGILGGVQAFIVIIASISIIIGSVGIANTMYTSVIERRKQIGVMKSIGARNSGIFLLFFIEAGLMGLIGGILGSLIGTVVAYVGTLGINAWIGSSVSPSINMGLIAGALIGSFVIGAFSGVLPALRAAHQNPVDALRG
ncbi:TPA: ABC transporter permease [Candidatus Woesearchaeota archaeon]|nr:ABC transporter permease [Candidatus Woesearchaeota archaeon]HII68692.1 ABC transporter permease [Candidatus Woesearchaeota archaeon]